MGRGAVIALLAATAAAAFALGRTTAPARERATQDDLAPAIRAALGEGDALTRQARTATLLEQLGRRDLPDVTAVYEGLIPSIDPWELAAFYVAWGRFDPSGAIEYALGRPRRSVLEERRIGLRAALASWARTDPGKARAAAEKLAAEHAPLRGDIWTGVAVGWARAPSETEELAAFLAELRPRRVRDSAAEEVVRELMRSGGASAMLGFAEGIVSDEDLAVDFRRTVFASAVRAGAPADPARTGAWELAHAELDSAAAEGCEIVARSWGRSDGAAAIGWLEDHPVEACREAALREAFLSWATADWSGAEAWLDSREPSAFLDPATEVYVGQLLAWEPARALGRCDRVQVEERRQRCFVSNAKRWYAEDAVAAEEWLQTSPLDEEARAEVRKSTGTERPGRGKRKRRPGAG